MSATHAGLAVGSYSVTLHDRIVFGLPAAEAVLAEAERYGAKRVFLTSTRSLAQKQDGPLQRLEKALSQREHLSNATAKVVETVGATAKAQFDKARDGIQAWRDGTIRKAHHGCGPQDIMAPLHRFLVKHELPYTAWGLRWKAGRAEEPV